MKFELTMHNYVGLTGSLVGASNSWRYGRVWAGHARITYQYEVPAGTRLEIHAAESLDLPERLPASRPDFVDVYHNSVGNNVYVIKEGDIVDAQAGNGTRKKLSPAQNVQDCLRGKHYTSVAPIESRSTFRRTQTIHYVVANENGTASAIYRSERRSWAIRGNRLAQANMALSVFSLCDLGVALYTGRSSIGHLLSY